MQRINNFQTWCMLVVAVAIITVANRSTIFDQLEISEWIKITAGVFLALIGAAIAQRITEFFFKYYTVRKLIMRNKFVEGHWLLRTFDSPASNDNSPLLNLAIAYMSYERNSEEFKVESTRLGENNAIHVTQSEVAHVRTSGPKMRYLNFFKLASGIYDGRFGFSSGEFSYGNAFTKIPIHFEADISLQNDGTTRRQNAIRISEKTIRHFRKKCGSDWMRDLLKTMNELDSERTIEGRENALMRLVDDSDTDATKIRQSLKTMSIGTDA